MKTKATNRKCCCGLTLIEVLVVAAVVAVLGAFALTGLVNARKKSARIGCVDNLKQIGLAFRLWSTDQSVQFPMGRSTNGGGTLEVAGDVWRNFVVMSNAVVQQVGTPSQVYHNPANLFVANFIGSPGMNLVTGKYAAGVVHLDGGSAYPVPDGWKPVLSTALRNDDVIVGFRPEAAQVGEAGALSGVVYTSDLHGAYTMLHASLEGEAGRNVEDKIVHIRAPREVAHTMGARICFDLAPDMVRFFDPKTEAALTREVRS